MIIHALLRRCLPSALRCGTAAPLQLQRPPLPALVLQAAQSLSRAMLGPGKCLWRSYSCAIQRT
jgi:hypothetical protein